MSKELNKTYDPKDIEDRLYKKWEDNGYFHAEVDRSKKPFTIVMPPPNITGQLHMGHALDNTMQDILIRYKRMQGYNVLHPMGYDSFGLPAEQYAVNTGHHPNGFTQKNIETFSKQLRELGFDYDWSKMISTSEIKISCIVAEDDAKKAVEGLHKVFHLDCSEVAEVKGDLPEV